MDVIKDINQGDDEWFALRIGSLGGSSIKDAVAGGTGATRKKLLYRLAGEILSGEKYSGFTNEHMERGVLLEDEARQTYSFLEGVEVEQVAMFKYSEHEHYSPDGCIGNNGIIEIKCTIPSVHIETIISDKVPAAYRKQVAWGLREKEFCDFISYSPTVRDKPIWIKRAYRDEKLIKTLRCGATKFIEEMLSIVERIRA